MALASNTMKTLLASDSPFFHVLWPIIVRTAPYTFRRDVLYRVSSQFRAWCEADTMTRQSDRAKDNWLRNHHRNLLFHLLEDVTWLEWGADKAGFKNEELFVQFLRLAEMDPQPRRVTRYSSKTCLWTSSSQDAVMESSLDPTSGEYGPFYCHYLGLTGRATKMLTLYRFFEMNCTWEDIDWCRDWI